MRRSVVLVLGLALLASVTLAGGCGGSDGATSGSNGSGVESTAAAASRAPAPDFSGVTLAGTEASLKSYRGKPLVLIFWASW